MKYYSSTGRRNHGRPLKRLLDTWDRNGSTSGPTPWQIYDDRHYWGKLCKCNTEGCSYNHCWSAKAGSITSYIFWVRL